MREGNEACALEGFARRDVLRAAAGGAHLITFTLEFLDERRSEAALTLWLGDFHIDVGVGPVRMKRWMGSGIGGRSFHLL